ncbi:MAG: metallophosphoesterase [Planctomycetota bacterium]|nr:metallophosphoesterase [Planctomycetota bacterium]
MRIEVCFACRAYPIAAVLIVWSCMGVWTSWLGAQTVPIDRAALRKFAPRQPRATTAFSLVQVSQAIKSHVGGFQVVFENQVRLLDGRVIGADRLYGRVLVGPYPFQARISRFRRKRFSDDDVALVRGRATVPLDPFFTRGSTRNSEGWGSGSQGSLAVRLELSLANQGPDTRLGVYDTFVTVQHSPEGYQLQPSILEGPLIHRVNSDHPEWVVLSLVTDVTEGVVVHLSDGRQVMGVALPTEETGWYRYEIQLDGLKAATTYRYQVRVGPTHSAEVAFRTAPPKGAATVRFAFIGDSRAGVAHGLTRYVGVNYDVMERLSALALQADSQLILFGGDLCSGYTDIEGDFRAQLRAWKQTVSGLGGRVPVYTIPGNHEALMYSVADPASRYGIGFDRWPYATASTEAVFADEMVNPTNAPVPRPGFPPYRETAYSFQYGCVRFIGLNTNYWLQSDTPRNPARGQQINQLSAVYGGCPEGYVMEEQLRWLEGEIRHAEEDPTVRYSVLFGHEPVFPNGKHLADAMWYNGDNRSRAHVFVDGQLVPAKQGILEVRNRIARAVSAAKKMACVINSDEHAYYRTLIDKRVPVGDESDLQEGRVGVTDGRVSPLSGLSGPKWYVVSGGGGAPYSAEKSSPWNRYWKKRSDRRGYRYSPQEHVVLFEASPQGLALRVVNSLGEQIDYEANLLESAAAVASEP